MCFSKSSFNHNKQFQSTSQVEILPKKGSIFQFIDFSFQTIFSSDSLLCLVHESVEGVVEGEHEVGVVDRRLGAWEKDVI